MNTKHTNRSSSSWPKISAAKNTLNYKHFLLTCLVISYTWLEEISSLSFSQKCKTASEHCCWCNHGFPIIQKLSPKNEWKSVSGKTKLFTILSQRKKKWEVGPWTLVISTTKLARRSTLWWNDRGHAERGSTTLWDWYFFFRLFAKWMYYCNSYSYSKTVSDPSFKEKRIKRHFIWIIEFLLS